MAQDSYDLAGSRGLSDFDARHRFVISAIYVLPFRGNRLVDGWQLAAIVQSQSGNPVNIVTTNSHGERRGGHTQTRCQWSHQDPRQR